MRYQRLILFILYLVVESSYSYAQNIRSISVTKIYTSDGTFTLTDIGDVTDFDPDNEIFANAEVTLFIVGGGGGGGRGNFAGGGGGGEVIIQNVILNLNSSLNISIGTGGLGARKPGNNSNNGQNGNDTNVSLVSGGFNQSFNSRGGLGGNNNGNGGRSGNNNLGGSQNGSGQNTKGGGGGGSANPGTNGTGTGVTSTGGAGGDGAVSSINGNAYGAGGGGNGRNGGAGGSGGVGGNANPSGNGSNGLPNRGAGGGAGGPSNEGGNGSDGKVIVQILYRILPIELINFKVNLNSEKRETLLSWSTAKEWENSHFEIERSINGIKNWKKIGEVPGYGYSDGPRDYSFFDNNLPEFGGSVFYRLKQVDYNSSYSYSNTKGIFLEPLDSSLEWKVYPNPSGPNTNLKIERINSNLLNENQISVELSDPSGKIYLASQIKAEQISALVSSVLTKSPKGMYVLKIFSETQSQVLRLTRQ